MKKILVVSIVTALAVASLGVGAEAKKKSKGKSLTFFLHWDDPANDCSGPTFIDLVDAPDSGDGCGYAVQMTGLNEVLGVTGQGYLTRSWPTNKMKPFRLDASKPLKGFFATMGWAHPVQAGNGVLDVVVSGTTGGSSVELAAVSTTYTVTPAGGNVVEFSVALPKKLNGKKFTALDVTTNMHGVAVGQHYIELERPSAHIIVPTK